MTIDNNLAKGAGPLAQRLAGAILNHLIENKAEAGSHLNAAALAETFNVSRFPIREALSLLADQEVVEMRSGKGFFLCRLPDKPSRPEALLARVAEDDLFFRIFQDKLAGELPSEFNESDLIRRYSMSRAQVRDGLERLAREGWIERRLGYGWSFASVSPQSLEHSYRLRMAFEPAGLMEPSFKVAPDPFNYWRGLMQDLRERPDQFSSAQLFSIGSRFHEMLMECTNNPFFLDTLKRLNRLRQMIEFHLPVTKRDLARTQVDEHIELLDRLEDGDFMGASTLMRRHLDVVGRRKIQSLSSDSDEKNL